MKMIIKLLIPLLTLFVSCDGTDEEKPIVITPEEISIYKGNNIVADGNMDSEEWADANHVEISMVDRENIKIFVKHNDESLLLMFILNNPSVTSVVFPEILIDANNNKSESWMSDDWWFHVSGSDCVSQGSYSVYTNCEVEQPDWYAVPNYPTSSPGIVDTIEVIIPFSKVGISKGETFGLALLVTNTVNLVKYWPTNANIHKPSSWSNAKID